MALSIKRGGVELLAYTMTGRMHERIGKARDFLIAADFKLARDTRVVSEHTFEPSSVYTTFYSRAVWMKTFECMLV